MAGRGMTIWNSAENDAIREKEFGGGIKKFVCGAEPAVHPNICLSL